MGVALSSHSLADEKLRTLVTEYTKQSLKTVEECWRIFVDEAQSRRAMTYAQFDEVFGMIMRDTEPHFAIFERIVDGHAVVNGYEVLVGICVALQVDIKRKLHFIFRMYVNEKHENFIESNMKLTIYHDFVQAMTAMLKLTDGPSPEKTNSMEMALRGTEESRPYITLKEAIEFSLTHPYICAFFDELHVLFAGLSSVDKPVPLLKKVDPAPEMTFMEDDLPASAFDPEILWATKIRDVGGRAFYDEDMFQVPEDLQCFLALKELQLRKRTFALVYERNKGSKSTERSYIGLVHYETFARCLLLVLPSLEVHFKSTGSYLVNVSKVSDADLVKMETQIAEAGRKFASMTLREVIQLTRENDEFLTVKQKPSLHLSYSDDTLFNLVHRFASHDAFVPVAHSPKCKFPVLGVLTPFDVVRFILEDVSLLNGKELYPLRALDCIYKPTSMHRSSASMYEAFALLRARKLGGVLLDNDNNEGYSTFGWHDILELVESWPSKLNFVANINYPVNLPTSITPTVSLPHFSNLVFPIVHVLKNKPPLTIDINTSVASALTVFYTSRVHRLYTVDDAGSVIGVLRLVDLLRLFLEEQRRMHQKKF